MNTAAVEIIKFYKWWWFKMKCNNAQNIDLTWRHYAKYKEDKKSINGNGKKTT